jgi:hypothetical protein
MSPMSPMVDRAQTGSSMPVKGQADADGDRVQDRHADQPAPVRAPAAMACPMVKLATDDIEKNAIA